MSVTQIQSLMAPLESESLMCAVVYQIPVPVQVQVAGSIIFLANHVHSKLGCCAYIFIRNSDAVYRNRLEPYSGVSKWQSLLYFMYSYCQNDTIPVGSAQSFIYPTGFVIFFSTGYCIIELWLLYYYFHLILV
jgi:hypothetical protein